MVSTVRSSSRTRTPSSVVACVVCWLLCTTTLTRRSPPAAVTTSTAGCLGVMALSSSSISPSGRVASFSVPFRPSSALVRHKRTPTTPPSTTRLYAFSLSSSRFSASSRGASFSAPSRPIASLVRHNRRRRTTPLAPTTRLYGVRSTIQRVVRGAVRTLVREPKKDSKQEREPPQRLYRLMYYDQCDYQPENVARILAKTIPSLDRRVAYELTSRARMQGAAGVPLLLTTQKECELYGALLTQYGLTTNVVPHN